MYRTLARRVVARYLQAAPLDDYYTMPSLKSPSIVGWGGEKDPSFLEGATKYFETRKDSWAIIIQPDDVTFEEVEAYAAGNPKLRRSKIIVMKTERLSSDFKTPDWVVFHDIIGHGILHAAGSKIQKWDAQALHKALPPKFQLAKSLEENDFSPDIYAAIFFGRIPPDFLPKAINASLLSEYGRIPSENSIRTTTTRKMNKLYQSLQSDVALWTSLFKPGVPRVVSLWT